MAAAGTPEQVAAVDGSHTGSYLAGIVKPARRRRRAAGRVKVPAAA
jgi:hypothetical protein